MKIQNNPTQISEYNNQKAQKRSISANLFNQKRNVCFGNISAVPVYTMDLIARGGLCASFCVQDFLGMICPRIATGFNRNRDITGQYNYGEAAEVAIREILTGPPMFLIPMAMLWGFKKTIGKACDVPVEHIKGFTEIFKNSTAKKSLENKDIKKDFYQAIIKNVLTEATNGELTGDALLNETEHFVSSIQDIEKSKSKTICQKLIGKEVKGSKDDKMQALNDRFVELRKKFTKNPSDNFSTVNLKLKNGKISAVFDKFVSMLGNYTEDIQKFSAKNGLSVEKATVFGKKRAFSRNGIILAMLAGVSTFCLKIPDWYQLHEVNPALNGLVKDPAKNDNKKAAELNNEEQQNLLDTLHSPFEHKNSLTFLATTSRGGRNVSK